MKEPRIMQIIPAHDTVAVFGWRDIDADGTIKEQITERLPVICWALVADDEFYVMGMVAQEAGEIILVNQWEDFLEYEVANGGSHDDLPECNLPYSAIKEDVKHAIDEKHMRGSELDVIEYKHSSALEALKRFCSENI